MGDPLEKAQITLNGSETYYAQVVSDTTVTWTGSGTVENLSPSIEYSGGWYRFNNPFGDTLVDTIGFTAVHVEGGSGNDSDYSLETFSTATVPDGGSSLGLAVLSVCALLALRRRHGF